MIIYLGLLPHFGNLWPEFWLQFVCIYILLGIHSLLLLAGFSWSGDFELKIWVDLLTSFAVIFWRNIWLHICGSEALTQCLSCVTRINGLWLVNFLIFLFHNFFSLIFSVLVPLLSAPLRSFYIFKASLYWICFCS